MDAGLNLKKGKQHNKSRRVEVSSVISQSCIWLVFFLFLSCG